MDNSKLWATVIELRLLKGFVFYSKPRSVGILQRRAMAPRPTYDVDSLICIRMLKWSVRGEFSAVCGEDERAPRWASVQTKTVVQTKTGQLVDGVYNYRLRGVAQPGSALGLGPRGRRFESSRPDSIQRRCRRQPGGLSFRTLATAYANPNHAELDVERYSHRISEERPRRSVIDYSL
jgi:hypothetical protein